SRQADKRDSVAPWRHAPHPRFGSGTTPFPKSAVWKGRGRWAPAPATAAPNVSDAADPLPLAGGSTQRPTVHALPPLTYARRRARLRKPMPLARGEVPTRFARLGLTTLGRAAIPARSFATVPVDAGALRPSKCL